MRPLNVLNDIGELLFDVCLITSKEDYNVIESVNSDVDPNILSSQLLILKFFTVDLVVKLTLDDRREEIGPILQTFHSKLSGHFNSNDKEVVNNIIEQYYHTYGQIQNVLEDLGDEIALTFSRICGSSDENTKFAGLAVFSQFVGAVKESCELEEVIK